jgi:hypothetical protein
VNFSSGKTTSGDVRASPAARPRPAPVHFQRKPG